ncbi:MAG: hypothetical protein BWY76_00442 [bacterium ADurb.Bin429]|nr:MAG: hypothetical protein BWY76_00442 [bacterium ADurb.Bin429]
MRHLGKIEQDDFIGGIAQQIEVGRVGIQEMSIQTDGGDANASLLEYGAEAFFTRVNSCFRLFAFGDILHRAKKLDDLAFIVTDDLE